MRLIDADALIEKAWDADTRVGYVQVVDVGDIKDAPTIESENKTGRWIEVNGKLWRGFECDQCGHKSDYKERYCAHCGAKMER